MEKWKNNFTIQRLVFRSAVTNFVQVSPAVPRRPSSSLGGGGGGGGGGGLLLPEDRGVDDGGGGRRRGLHHSRSMGGEGGGEKASSLARDSHPILKSRSNCWAILQCRGAVTRESLCGKTIVKRKGTEIMNLRLHFYVCLLPVIHELYFNNGAAVTE